MVKLKGQVLAARKKEPPPIVTHNIVDTFVSFLILNSSFEFNQEKKKRKQEQEQTK